MNYALIFMEHFIFGPLNFSEALMKMGELATPESVGQYRIAPLDGAFLFELRVKAARGWTVEGYCCRADEAQQWFVANIMRGRAVDWTPVPSVDAGQYTRASSRGHLAVLDGHVA
jgi:hypothetical protein